MILHSYTPNYSWSSDINVGIQRILTDLSWVEIRYHYMDTKNANESQLRRASINAQLDIDNYSPDIIIAIDDNANKLVAKNFVDNKEVIIIFAGVNGSVKPYGYEGANNVWGIFERKPIPALIDLLNIMNRYQLHETDVMFLSDKSTSAHHDADYMSGADWESIDYNGHIAVATFSEWKKIIKNIPDDIDYVLVGGYRKLKVSADNDSNVSPSEVAKWTVENSKKLVIGLNAFNSEDGINISVGVSPYEQGEVVASLAIRLLQRKNKPVANDFITPKQYIVSINESLFMGELLSSEVPKILEAFARATRHYYHTDQGTSKKVIH